MGLLKFIKERNKAGLDFMKDHPMVTGVYGSQMLDHVLRKETEPFIDEGKREGYVKASKKYEEKLLKQTDEFLKQKRDFTKERDEYENLLNEYEKTISELDSKQKKSEHEKELLIELLMKENKLKALAE